MLFVDRGRPFLHIAEGLQQGCSLKGVDKMATKADKILKAALPDNEEIKAEYDRLIKLYKSAPKEKLALARKLISISAFHAITVE